MRPSSDSFYSCYSSIEIKSITKIRLGLSHLREQKFKHSFQDSINSVCNYCNDVESAIHVFLYCPLYSNKRFTLLSKIDCKLLDNNNSSLTQILLFGNLSFTTNDNTKIITLTIGLLCQLTDSIGCFYEQWFFSSLIQTNINKPALYYFYYQLSHFI